MFENSFEKVCKYPKFFKYYIDENNWKTYKYICYYKYLITYVGPCQFIVFQFVFLFSNILISFLLRASPIVPCAQTLHTSGKIWIVVQKKQEKKNVTQLGLPKMYCLTVLIGFLDKLQPRLNTHSMAVISFTSLSNYFKNCLAYCLTPILRVL